MEKKELKFYETPVSEVVSLKLNTSLLGTSATESIGGDEKDEEIDY